MKLLAFISVLVWVAISSASIRGIQLPKSHFYVNKYAELTYFNGYYFCGFKGGEFAFTMDEDYSFFVKDRAGNFVAYKDSRNKLPGAFFWVFEKISGPAHFPKFVFQIDGQFESYFILKNDLKEKGVEVPLRYNSAIRHKILDNPYEYKISATICAGAPAN